MLRAFALACLLACLPATAQAQVTPPSRGGTGLSTLPTYGQLLVGNALGGYTLTATSSLGISAGSGLTFDYLFPADATSTLISFEGGLLSVGSTTVSGNATTTGMHGVGSLFINGERFTDLTGTGLTNSGGVLTLDATGDWTGTFDGREGSSYLADAFSTTSADHWQTLRNFFSTTSADYWKTQRNFFSTTSADYLLSTYSKGFFFSTTSADYWETQQAPRGITSYDAFTHPASGVSATTSTLRLAGLNASSTVLFDNATSTLLTATTAWLTNLFIGVDTLAEYISDTAGAMVSGNTESGISVAYQDSDNTLDFTVSAGVSNLASADFGDWTCNGSACTVDANAIALGTDTTNNYVATVSSSGSITVGNSGSETAAVTVNVNMANANTWTALQTFANASSTLFSTGYASSTQWWGGGLLATCASGSFLTWNAGQFGCDTDDNTTYTAGDHITLTGTDFDVDDDFLLNTGDTGTGLYSLANSSTSLASFGYASSTLWYGGGLATCESGNFLTWASGQFGCGADVVGSGGTGIATSGPIADTEIIYATAAGTVDSEAAFTYDDATNLLTVANASTTLLSAYNGFFDFFKATSTTATSTITNSLRINSGSGDNALSIAANRVYPASNSVGGMVLLSNGTTNTGPALVAYTNVSSSAGNLANFRCDNSSMAHDCVKIDHDGAGDGLAIAATAAASNALSLSNTGLDHTLNASYTGTTANKGAANFTSTNPDGSTLQVTDVADGLGAVKITQNSASNSSDSAVLSLSQQGSAGQGIVLDTTSSYTGKLINFRIDGGEVFTINSAGKLTFGNASSSLLSASYASSTLWYGGGLSSTCASGNFLTWTAGVFGCAADQTGAGGADDFTWQTTFNQLSAATTSSLWVRGNNLFASSTLYVDTYKISTSSANYLDVQNKSSQAYSLLRIKAPNANPDEATLSLLIDIDGNDDGTNEEFVDFYNEHYPNSVQSGFRQAYSGTGLAKPIAFGHWDVAVGASGKDAGNKLLIMPSGTVAVARATSTVPANTALYVASSSATNLFKVDSTPGTNKFLVRGGSGATDVLSDLVVGNGTSIVSRNASANAETYIFNNGASGLNDLTITAFGSASLRLLDNSIILSGSVDQSSATVKQHTYPKFTWPGVATTTTATTTVPMGQAMTAETFNFSTCKVTSGTGGYRYSDGTNHMNYVPASTTRGRYTISTNNTFIADEPREIQVGPMTNAQLTCGQDITVN